MLLGLVIGGIVILLAGLAIIATCGCGYCGCGGDAAAAASTDDGGATAKAVKPAEKEAEAA